MDMYCNKILDCIEYYILLCYHVYIVVWGWSQTAESRAWEVSNGYDGSDKGELWYENEESGKESSNGNYSNTQLVTITTHNL